MYEFSHHTKVYCFFLFQYSLPFSLSLPRLNLHRQLLKSQITWYMYWLTRLKVSLWAFWFLYPTASLKWGKAAEVKKINRSIQYIKYCMFAIFFLLRSFHPVNFCFAQLHLTHRQEDIFNVCSAFLELANNRAAQQPTFLEESDWVSAGQTVSSCTTISVTHTVFIQSHLLIFLLSFAHFSEFNGFIGSSQIIQNTKHGQKHHKCRFMRFKDNHGGSQGWQMVPWFFWPRDERQCGVEQVSSVNASHIWCNFTSMGTMIFWLLPHCFSNPPPSDVHLFSMRQQWSSG